MTKKIEEINDIINLEIEDMKRGYEKEQYVINRINQTADKVKEVVAKAIFDDIEKLKIKRCSNLKIDKWNDSLDRILEGIKKKYLGDKP